MKIAPPEILEKIKSLLKHKYKREIRWRGEKLERKMLERGWYKCQGTEAYRKRFGSVSVHIKCYAHGCYYHIDSH